MVGKNFLAYYDKLAERASEFQKQIDYLKEVVPINGLAISKYPIGMKLSTLKKISEIINTKISFTGNHYMTISTTEEGIYHLVLNSAPIHDDFERKQAKTGGFSSKEVIDIGEVRIAVIENDVQVDEADFSLYLTSDDYII